MTKYLIGIWGQYGDPGTRIADGQAVRTTIITEESMEEPSVSLFFPLRVYGREFKKNHYFACRQWFQGIYAYSHAFECFIQT